VQLSASGLAFRRGTPPDAVYTFKHALVQDAAYDSLLRSRRQELHGKIARVIEQRFPSVTTTEPEVLGAMRPEPPKPARRYDPLRDAAPPEVTRGFDRAAARSTDPAAPNFDRDAADAKWQEAVAAAGIAKDRTGTQPPAADPPTEPRATILEDYYPAADQELLQPARSAEGAKSPAGARTAPQPPEIAASGIFDAFARAAGAVGGFLFGWIGGSPPQPALGATGEEQTRGAMQTDNTDPATRQVDALNDSAKVRATAADEADIRLAQALAGVTPDDENETSDEQEHEQQRSRRKRGRSL
jgi:hypothetical protein